MALLVLEMLYQRALLEQEVVLKGPASARNVGVSENIIIAIIIKLCITV